MIQAQKLQLRLSEIRKKLNEISALDEPSEDQGQEMVRLTAEFPATEERWRAATLAEVDDANDKQTTPEPDPEERETRRLLARSNVLPFVNEAVDGHPVDGAEKELRAAPLGDDAGPGMMPVDLLLPPDELEQRAQPAELRTDAVTPVDSAALADGSQASVLERVFTRSVAARLGVAMPSVPVGAAVYPIMTGGTTASMAADATQVDAAAGTFTGHTLEPIRLTAAYLFNMRQSYQLRNFEQILRRDLSAVMSDKMDNEIINGDGSAPNVSGFLTELEAPDNPSAVTTWAQFLAPFTNKVDGLNAYGLGYLRSVIGKATFTYGHGLFRTGATDNGPPSSGFEYVRERIGGLSVSSRIPAPASTGGAANIQTNIMALTSYPGRNAVAPVWRGMELIRDPYTNAGKGQVRLTAIAFWSFKILREAGWNLWKVKTA